MKIIKPNVVPFQAITAFARPSTATYIDSSGVFQTAAIDAIRFTYNPITLAFEGALLEPQRTNEFINSNTFASQTVSGLISGSTYTISFYGTGTITWGAGIFTLTGTGDYPQRVSTTLVASATSMSFNLATTSGTVRYAQLELGSSATTYIPTGGAKVTRSADSYGTTGIIYTNAVDTTSRWGSLSGYSAGAQVAYNYKNYEALTAVPANTPPQTNPLVPDTYWRLLGPNNIYSPFNPESSGRSYLPAPSAAPATLSYVIKANTGESIKAVALFGIYSKTPVSSYPIVVRIAAKNSSTGAVYSYSKTLSNQNDSNAVFQDITTGCDLITVQLYVATSSSQLEIGSIILGGSLTDIGSTDYGLNAGIVDYSKKDTDVFGNTIFTQRSFSKKLSCRVMLLNTTLSSVTRLLYNIRATPSVWIPTDETTLKDALSVFGYYKDFSISIEHPVHSYCNLEIEGLV